MKKLFLYILILISVQGYSQTRQEIVGILGTNAQQVIDPTDPKYKAVGDVVVLLDGTWAANTDTIHSNYANFTSADVGKLLQVSGNGADFNELNTTIIAVVNAHKIQIGVTNTLPSTATFQQHVSYGTDQTAKFRAAIADVPAGGILHIPHTALPFLIQDSLNITKTMTIMGDGGGTSDYGNTAGPSYLGQTVGNQNIYYTRAASQIFMFKNNKPVFSVNAFHVHFEDFAIGNFTDQADSGSAGIEFIMGVGFKLKGMSIRNFYNNVDMMDAYHWTMQNCWIAGAQNYNLRIRSMLIPDAGDFAISDCWFFQDLHYGFSDIYQESSGAGKISNTKFNSSGSVNQYHYFGTVAGTSDFIFSNCSMEWYQISAIRFSTSFSNISITGCQFAGINQNPATDVDITSGVNVCVSGNNFAAGGTSTIPIKLTGTTMYSGFNTYYNYTPAFLEPIVNNYTDNHGVGVMKSLNLSTGTSASNSIQIGVNATYGAQMFYYPSNYTTAALQNTAWFGTSTAANKTIVSSPTTIGIDGGVITKRTTVADAAYTLLISDYEVAYTSLTATRAVSPPSTPGTNQTWVIKNETANTFPITFVGTLDGAVNPTLISSAYGYIKIKYNGTAWFTHSTGLSLTTKQNITTAATGLTAAGTTQGTALALSGNNSIQEITTAASGTGVILPVAAVASSITVINRGANAIIVYPATSGTINNQSANTGYTLGVNNSVTFLGKSATGWYTANDFQGGDVSSGDGTNALTIGTNKVTRGMQAQGAGTSIIGNSTSSTANVADITASADGQILTRKAGALSWQQLGGVASMTATSGAINTTETNLVSYTIAAGELIAGTHFRITCYGTCTSTVANASNIRVRLGTAGTSSDAVVGVITPTAATTGTSIPFQATFEVTILTTGSGGTINGNGFLTNTGVTGISSAAQGIVGTPSTAVAVNTTVSNIIHLSYVSAATTTTSTFQVASIEKVKQ